MYYSRLQYFVFFDLPPHNLGGCFGNDGKRYVIGGWAWACCCVTEVQR